MKKLTIALVALLLALACLFVACDNGTETPVVNPDDNQGQAQEDTASSEERVKAAEDLKAVFAELNADLYSSDVKAAIETERATALAKIAAAASKEDADKVIAEFRSFMTAQKTVYDELQGLIEKIGDVALKDEDLIKQAKAYKTTLDTAFAGSNTVKAAVLAAYAENEDLQDDIAAAIARLAQLKDAKDEADTKTTGVNAKIAALNELYAGEDYGFNLDSANEYAKVLAAVEKLAGDYKIEATSDAYAEIFDVDGLKAAKATLDAAIAADPLLQDMQAVIEAAQELEAAAEEARWKEYIDVDKTDLKNAADGTHTVAVKYEGATKYAAATLADDAKEENVVNVEKVIALDYKLALKADVEAAVKVLNNLKTRYSTAKLNAYGYNTAGNILKAAEDSINAIKGNYETSVGHALTGFANFTTTRFVDVEPEKEDTIDVWTGFTTADPKKDTYLTKLAAEIDDLKATFKTIDKDGNKLSYGAGMVTEVGYVSTGDYTVDGTHKVYLVNGQPAIKFVAWSYSYELGGKALGAVTEFDALDVLKTADNGATKAKAALKWLEMYIGEGNYAEKYDFSEYEPYAAGFDGKVLYMTDRAIDEVATAKTTEIKGVAVTTEKTPAVAAKVYSPYTIAQMLIAEQDKIDAAKKEALATIEAAALALRTAGDADAITDAEALYDAIVDGSYLNEKLYEDDAANAYLGVALAGKKVVVFEKTAKEEEVKVNISALIANAKAALNAVKALDSADTDAIAAAYAKVEADEAALNESTKLIALYDLYVENAKAAYDAAVAGNALSKYLVADGAVTAAKNAYTAVDQIKNLLLNKTVFDDANDGNKYVTVAAGAGNVAANKTNIKAVIDDFAPATSATITAAMKADLDTALAELAAGTKAARNTVTATLATDTEAFEAAFDAFKGYDAVKAKDARDDAAAIKAALTAINTFATNNKADFINLAYTVAFGEKVITFADPLTEVYRERLLAGNYDVILATVAYANTLHATAKAALDTTDAPNTWQAAAQTRVQATTVTLEAVTSIKAVTEFVKNYALGDDTYDFATALDLINDALELVPADTIDLKTLKGGIATKGYAW